MKTLGFALPVALALFAVACSAEPADPSVPVAEPDAEQPTKPAPKRDPKPAEQTPEAPQAETATPAATIATAKIRDGVRSFAASSDALWLATDTAVEKTALDGTAPAALAGFAGKTINLAFDGTRVYGLVDKGNFYEAFSTKGDGSEGAHHFNWLKSSGEPGNLALNGGRIFFSTSTTDVFKNRILSASATPPATGNAPYRTEEEVDAKAVVPAFTEGRLYAVDHVRQSAVRVSFVDSNAAIDFIQDKVPMTAGGIATDGIDVYTRTTKGIVRAPVTAGLNTTPTVVVPGTACPIFDEATGAESVLEDALVVDGTTIYAACRTGANVEIRAFAKDGTLTKTIAAAPYGAGLARLRITATTAYWLSKPTATTSDLWRAAK